MSALRLPIAIALGGLFTTSMFWLLWSLVGAAVDVGDMAEATRIDFSRMRRDTEVQTKRDEKVERERPPPAPEMPRMAFNVGGVDNNVAQLTPMLDARGAMSRMTMRAGSDRDVIPLVRIAPDYPPRALSRGLEGWVQVQFTITPTGQVKDPMVVNAEPEEHLRRRGAEGDRTVALQPEGRGRRRGRARRCANHHSLPARAIADHSADSSEGAGETPWNIMPRIGHFQALAAMVSPRSAGLRHVAVAQRAEQEGQGQAQGQGRRNAPAPTIDAATGKVLNEAIELLNMENYAGAKQKIGTLNLEKLSPYERSKVEQILFSIAVSEEKYDEARQHLKAAIDAGGFNEQEIDQARYQYAQLFMQEEKWKEGAAALEEWFTTATNPNSAAYYLLAVAYYQMEDHNKALAPAQKAVELMDKPQEAWVSCCSLCTSRRRSTGTRYRFSSA